MRMEVTRSPNPSNHVFIRTPGSACLRLKLHKISYKVLYLDDTAGFLAAGVEFMTWDDHSMQKTGWSEANNKKSLHAKL